MLCRELGMKGHWDEEIHGLDYLVYAYLQQGNDAKAKEQVDYLFTMDAVFPLNNKIAYTFASVPTRFALERKDWKAAAALELKADFPWADFHWEKSNVFFGRVLGTVHAHDLDKAITALKELHNNHAVLEEKNNTYEANQVNIQMKAADAWIQSLKGNKNGAFSL